MIFMDFETTGFLNTFAHTQTTEKKQIKKRKAETKCLHT